MTARRYVLHAGWVRSANDGQDHYISALALARLYGVPLNQCVCAPTARHEFFGWQEPPGAIHLRPSPSGNYTLPTT